jgi:hypothetical protein
MADTMTSDGVPITFHAITVLQVTDSVSLIKNFGPDWYKNNLEEPFKTMVRQASVCDVGTRSGPAPSRLRVQLITASNDTKP